nr:hypothetical protein [Tanacetum cinerariifolium]
MASSKLLLLSLSLLLVAHSFVPNFTSASLEEANALQKWKASLKIPNNSQIVSSWTPLLTNTSAPASCPSWFGIACNADGNINMLNLSTSELQGTLHQFPFSILRNLTHFELSVNSFFGPIPPEIGLLSKLAYLDFSTNQFSGVIPPTIAKLSQLTVLQLFGNNLTGSIPSSLGDLKSLTILYLYKNKLSGPIPIELGNMKSLTKLDLSDNQLNGSIPSSLGDLTSLNLFYLDTNQLCGPIPIELGNMKSLTKLDLNYNQLSGSIPSLLGDLKSLTRLALSVNQLNGSIPSSLKKLRNLQTLNLRANKLSGPIPQGIGSLQLLRLHLDTNKLSGQLPDDLCQGGKLQYLSVSKNQLSGPIPRGLWNCSTLIRVRFEINQFQGDISNIFGVYPSLNFFDVSHNKFHGQLSQNWDSKGAWGDEKFDNLSLSVNNLSGVIPQELGSLSQLNVIDLSKDSYLPRGIDIDLSYNELTGPVPPYAVFLNVSGEALQGNDGLCGNVTGLKLCESQIIMKKNNHFHHKLILVTMVPVFAAMYDEIIKATNDFDEAYCIGTGGYAKLLKLDSSNRTAVVGTYGYIAPASVLSE